MEVFVKNELDEDFSEFNAKTRICCGLCDKGNLIQQQIVQHLKKKHSKEFGKRMLINSCSCPENVQLQISLINHLLSHISFDKYNVPSSPANEIYERKLKTDEDSSEDNSWDEDDFPHPEVEFNFVSDVSQISTSNLSLQGAIEDEEIFKCSDCPVVRSTQIGLTSHTQREHDPSNLFLCSIDNTICRSRFKTSELLKNHLKYHYIGFNNSEQTSKNCAVCSRSYKTKESLMKHVKRHLNAEETYTKNAEDIEYYQCDKCEKKWPKHQKTNLRQHIIKVHLKSATKLRPMLKRRSRKDPTGKVICYICSEYVLPSSLKQHIFNRHDKRSENVCEIEGCGACFLYPSGLQKHKEFHQGIKKMECEYCGKKFSETGNLRKHLLRHTDPDMFQCAICSKRFGSSRSLWFHKRTHEKDDGLRPFACDHCDRVYKYQVSLRRHVKLTHESDQTLVNCELCSFIGLTDSVRRHLHRVHNVKKRNKYVFADYVDSS